MSENENLDAVREKMLELIEAGKTDATFSKERPVRWEPTKITNPDPVVGMPFTPRGCWYFIEKLLRNRHPIEGITLEKPPGEKGYVMLFKQETGQDIYIKLQFGKGQEWLFGRSFHYSDPERNNRS